MHRFVLDGRANDEETLFLGRKGVRLVGVNAVASENKAAISINIVGRFIISFN